jgi:plastocyanin
MQSKRFVAFPVLCAVLGLIAFAAAGCGSGGNDSTSAATTEPNGGSASSGSNPAPSGDAVRSAKVEIAEFAYDPDPVTIEEGGKVIWVNEDSVAHTATAEDGSFDTGTIDEGKLKSESFKEPGTYQYVCSIHPQMHGTVEVVPAG